MLVLEHEDGTRERSSGIVRIPPEGAIPVPAFSPDGVWLAWDGATSAGAPSELMIAQLGSGARAAPTCARCSAGSHGSGAIWSPDGGSVMWSQDGHVVVAHTGEWAGSIVADGFPVSWSPDGSVVAYVRLDRDRLSSTIYVRPVAGGPETPVVQVTDNRGLADEMAWSPDGKHLVVPLQAAESKKVYGFDPATGALHAFGVLLPEFVPLTLSPDGMAIFEPGFNSVWPLDGSASRTFGGGVLTDWSSDGQRVLVTGRGLDEVDLASGAETHLLDGNVQDAAWSPNEREIAFVRDQRLEVLDVANGDVRQIAPLTIKVPFAGVIGDGYVAWSPDGAHILIAEGFGQVAEDLYEVDADGEHLQKVIDAAVVARYMRFSPDGRYLAFTDLRGPDIDVVDVTTRKVASIAGIDGGQVTWAGDGLLADTPLGISLVQLDGSARLLVEGTGGCVVRLIGWTGSEVVFSNYCTHMGL